MAREFSPSARVERIRRQIDHPIVDADGHYVEFAPLVKDILWEVAGRDVLERFERYAGRGGHLPVRGFWGLPEKATLDRMTASLPELLYRRLDELGIDFAILYPTPGPVMTQPDGEVRQAVCRATNIYSAEVYAPYRDRLAPAALIPTFTPEEAVAELEYAADTLGLKVARLEGAVPRRVRPDGSEAAWVDSLGHGSLYSYDPLWARCQELGVLPAFHGVGFGWGTRVSLANYVHNHVGSFAAAQEGVCRSLVMGGAPRRFPGLRFAFLEGGVSWACQLYGDLLSHYEKRNRDVVRQFDPALFDVELAGELFDEFARGRIAERRAAFDRETKQRTESRQSLSTTTSLAAQGFDDFAESGITDPAQLAEIFSTQFGFGCEADDPLSSIAFERGLLPRGARLNALFSSDIGHWDVPDMRSVLAEAWELVEHGHLDAARFRDFTFGNVTRMLTDLDPDFFAGTVVEDAAQALRA